MPRRKDKQDYPLLFNIKSITRGQTILLEHLKLSPKILCGKHINKAGAQ